MNTFFAVELLILILLFIVEIRPLFLKKEQKDTLVCLVPVTLILALVLFFTAGVSVASLLIFFPTVFVAITNFNAICRLIDELIVDVYSPFAIIAHLFGTLFVVLSAFLFVYFNPYISDVSQLPKIYTFIAEQVKNESAVETKKVHFVGNFKDGLEQRQSFWQMPNATCYVFSLIDDGNAQNSQIDKNGQSAQQNTSDVVIFLPSVFANVQENQESINAIVQKGNIVISADFFVKDAPYFVQNLQSQDLSIKDASIVKNSRFLRSFVLRTKYFKDKTITNAQSEHFVALKQQEINFLYNFAQKEFPHQKISLIFADGKDATTAVLNFTSTIEGAPNIFSITDAIPGYIDGMGNLAIYQRIAYTFFAPVVTDGKTQAKLIALRGEKAK